MSDLRRVICVAGRAIGSLRFSAYLSVLCVNVAL